MPPKYRKVEDSFSDVKGPKGETFQDLRENRHITKRGGWKRLTLLGVLILIVVIALGVGLGIGLGVGLGRRKKDDRYEIYTLVLAITLPLLSAMLTHGTPSSGPSNSPPDSLSQNQSFPLGAYSFPTFLSTVATTCTPLASTWTCFPYKTYDQSPTGALATFTWIITSADNNTPNEYLISTTPNPFALTFTNATLRMVDMGLESEALTFRAPMQKIVVPNEDISRDSDGAASRCLYDETVFEGRLFTGRAKTYPTQDVNATSGGEQGEEGGDEFQPWPYGLEMGQTVSMEPECFKMVNEKMSERIGLVASGSGGGGECECRYRNFGT